MNNLNISANYYLRNLYGTDRSLVSKENRKIATNVSLSKADAKALGSGISSISDYDYDREEEDKLDFYNKLKAFSDTYNSTIDSGMDSVDDDTKRLIKKFKDLEKEYGDTLSDYGITFDEKGYMSVAKSAVDNISVSTFKDVLGEDSDFMKDLSSLQKKLYKHINLLA